VDDIRVYSLASSIMASSNDVMMTLPSSGTNKF